MSSKYLFDNEFKPGLLPADFWFIFHLEMITVSIFNLILTFLCISDYHNLDSLRNLYFPFINTQIYILGTNLVKKAIYAMVEGDCDEVSLSSV